MQKSSEALEKVLAMQIIDTTPEDAQMVQAIALVEIAGALTSMAELLLEARNESYSAKEQKDASTEV